MALLYFHYGTLFLQRPDELWWAGLASTIGRGTIPAVRRLDYMDLGVNLGLPTVSHFAIQQTRRMIVQGATAIFDNMAWQHHAYLAEGLKELRAMSDPGVGAIPPYVFYQGWCRIARGTPSEVAQGTKKLVEYEQREILQRYLEQIPWPFSAWMDVGAVATIPGVIDFWHFEPLGRFANFDDRFHWLEYQVLPAWSNPTPEWRTQQVQESMMGYSEYILR
jgi:hypothetical protein